MLTVGKNGFAAIQIIILHLTSLSIGAYRRRWHRGDKVFLAGSAQVNAVRSTFS
jgi:hypothetical protein